MPNSADDVPETLVRVPKFTWRLIGLIAICVSLVLLFRGLGVFLSFALSYMTASRGVGLGLFSNFKKQFWINGQLVVPYMALALCWLFDEQLLHSNLLYFLASSPIVEMPIDRIVLALTGDQTTYHELIVELHRQTGLRAIFLNHYSAIFVSIVVALIWYSIALPNVIAAQSGNLFKTTGELRVPIFRKDLVRLAVVAVLAMILQLDWVFLSGWAGRAALTTVTVPQFMLFLLIVFANMWKS